MPVALKNICRMTVLAKRFGVGIFQSNLSFYSIFLLTFQATYMVKK